MGGKNEMRTPNHHDFYPKDLIPIGLNDLMAFNESDKQHSDSTATHWLIAVEGVQLSQQKIYYHWKVSIYPADNEGDFNWKVPFYASPAVESIDHAIKLAGSFEILGKKDHLYSLCLQEKIS
jgi:hypothetical protein